MSDIRHVGNLCRSGHKTHKLGVGRHFVVGETIHGGFRQLTHLDGIVCLFTVNTHANKKTGTGGGGEGFG